MINGKPDKIMNDRLWKTENSLHLEYQTFPCTHRSESGRIQDRFDHIMPPALFVILHVYETNIL